jgi:hypothetical protein
MESEIMTPLDVYQRIVKEGYNVDYQRIPMYEYLPTNSEVLMNKRLFQMFSIN